MKITRQYFLENSIINSINPRFLLCRLLIFIHPQFILSMIYLKQAANKIRQKILSDKLLNQVHNGLLFQLVFLSTVLLLVIQIKDYLNKVTTEENLFVIPQAVIRSAKANRKVLVLDMDETLLHTRSLSKPSHGNYHEVEYEGSTMYIESRPLMQEFLEAVNEIFDVYVYTAGSKKYADIVLNKVDSKGIIQRRFYRDTCRKSNGMLVKDLKHLKRVCKIKADMILVDDNSISITNNYPFSLCIKEFEGNQDDKQLLEIFKSLLKFYV